MKCPVCNQLLERTYVDVLDGWCTMEEEYQCKEGHYSYYFATGITEVCVDDNIALAYSYNSAPSRLEQLHYNLVLLRAKILYKRIQSKRKKEKKPCT